MIEAGLVIRQFVKDTNPPKFKRYIIIAKSNDLGNVATIFINSRINTNIHSTLELRDLHIPIKESIREYLDRDSYIDCSQIRERDYAEIYTAVSQDPNLVIGKLSEADLQDVLETLKNAKTISIYHKKKYNLL